MPTESKRDFFHDFYDRKQIAYGDVPSRPLASYVEQQQSWIENSAVEASSLQAIDLGAGAGRDTVFLARKGFQVTAVDLSDRGLLRVKERAEDAGVQAQVQTRVSDVREYDFPVGKVDAVIATTVLDHIPDCDAVPLFAKMAKSLSSSGWMYVEVHSTEDPACLDRPSSLEDAPQSETADAVVNYFAPGQLVRLALDAEHDLRVLFYEERLEWDYTHGPEHQHGKQILLATRRSNHPEWYGVEMPFARNS